ncbi:E3 ubiquitin-protein ligase TRIM39-like [Rana temporaria]|uniref:E3 ubiquitin-protein ligase TRIM39-like n=1 Tax=Rana temporaria TaxID=8407 RepID=UPI001AACFFC1|nr:E3 ubiquitin-protein ligase TRIM39-like [Rana temporaria]
MASAALSAELECSVCLNIYTDPVNLSCGHSFCRVCIDHVLDTQERSGRYSCPACREGFRKRPALQRNITLRSIAETFQAAQPGQAVSGNVCTYCIDFPVSAAKCCLLCESYICEDHLRVHSKSPEHVLCDPTTSLEKRKCLIHRKVLEYYCTVDAACICVGCSLAGEHRGHQVETLGEASMKEKQELRNLLQSLTTKREEMEERVRSLEEHRRNAENKAYDVTERVDVLFRDLRRRLEDLEKKVLDGIIDRAQRVSVSLSDQIQKLEIKKEELSRRMRHIEELCNVTDPLTLLQGSDTRDFYDGEDGDQILHDGGDLDVTRILHTLYTGLSDMTTMEHVCFNIQEAADLLLDENTAHSNLLLSEDMKTASWLDIKLERPEAPDRFQNRAQVLSRQRFSSGRHYWEVDVGKSQHWIVGMCYPSIERAGWARSRIGNNQRSWGLLRHENQYVVTHNGKEIQLPCDITSRTVRVYLDYEAGRISFYDLCDPIRHLHTFTATFTEPLHAGVWLLDGGVKILGGGQ